MFNSLFNSLILEFSEPAILRFIQKFKSDAIDERTIRRYLQDFEKYKAKLAIKDPGQYKTFIELEQAVDAVKGEAEFKKRNVNDTKDTSSMEAEAIANDEDVIIYKGDAEHKCVKYGKGYSFCISRLGAGNMYGSYRLQKASSFYFIFFKKVSKEDDKHIMVLDKTDKGWEWTFGNNGTRVVKGGWDEVIEQFPVLQKYESLFTNKPLTEKEKENTTTLQSFQDEQSLEKFKSCDYELKNLIVKSGVTLKDDIYKVLDSNLKNEYISSGSSLTRYQADSLNPSQVNRYRKVRAQTIDQFLQTNLYELRPSKLDIGLSESLWFDSDTNTYIASIVDSGGAKSADAKYDINGNLINYVDHKNAGFDTQLEYDDRGNLIYYSNTEDETAWYEYDENNNQISKKTIDHRGTLTTKYFYVGDQIRYEFSTLVDSKNHEERVFASVDEYVYFVIGDKSNIYNLYDSELSQDPFKVGRMISTNFDGEIVIELPNKNNLPYGKIYWVNKQFDTRFDLPTIMLKYYVTGKVPEQSTLTESKNFISFFNKYYIV